MVWRCSRSHQQIASNVPSVKKYDINIRQIEFNNTRTWGKKRWKSRWKKILFSLAKVDVNATNYFSFSRSKWFFGARVLLALDAGQTLKTFIRLSRACVLCALCVPASEHQARLAVNDDVPRSSHRSHCLVHGILLIVSGDKFDGKPSIKHTIWTNFSPLAKNQLFC